MMTLLAERPLIVSLFLAVLAAGLLWGWLQSGRMPLAWTGLAVVLLIPLAWWLADRWVTDRELIERLIYQTADAVEQNDVEGALRLIGDPATRTQAAAELPRYDFTRADVGGIREVTIVENSVPLRAEVDMNVNVEVSDRRGSIRNVRVLRRLLLTFEKRAEPTDSGATSSSSTGGWIVTGYEHMPIIGGPDPYTTRPIP